MEIFLKIGGYCKIVRSSEPQNLFDFASNFYISDLHTIKGDDNDYVSCLNSFKKESLEVKKTDADLFKSNSYQ